MPIWEVTTRTKARANGELIEKGMTVEIVLPVSTPWNTQQGKEKIAQAFLSKYGVDMKKAHWLSSVYLEVIRLDK